MRSVPLVLALLALPAAPPADAHPVQESWTPRRLAPEEARRAWPAMAERSVAGEVAARVFCLRYHAESPAPPVPWLDRLGTALELIRLEGKDAELYELPAALLEESTVEAERFGPRLSGRLLDELCLASREPGLRSRAQRAREVLLRATGSSEAPAPRSFAGRVTWLGALPALPPIPIAALRARDCCELDDAMDLADRTLRVGAAGGLADAIVMLERVGGEPVAQAGPTRPAELTVRHCLFEPYVLLARPGQRVVVTSEDPGHHLFHAFCVKNAGVNRSLAPGQSFTLELDEPELIPVRDDVHTWMQSWICVTRADFAAVTGRDGRFRFEDVPDGEYRLVVRHPNGARETREVELTGADRPAVKIALSPPREGR